MTSSLKQHIQKPCCHFISCHLQMTWYCPSVQQAGMGSFAEFRCLSESWESETVQTLYSFNLVATVPKPGLTVSLLHKGWKRHMHPWPPNILRTVGPTQGQMHSSSGPQQFTASAPCPGRGFLYWDLLSLGNHSCSHLQSDYWLNSFHIYSPCSLLTSPQRTHMQGKHTAAHKA